MSDKPERGWYPDPSPVADTRWWDGDSWTFVVGPDNMVSQQGIDLGRLPPPEAWTKVRSQTPASDADDGWRPDPFGIHEERLFKDREPTPLVRDGGIGSYDGSVLAVSKSQEGSLNQTPIQVQSLDPEKDPSLTLGYVEKPGIDLAQANSIATQGIPRRRRSPIWFAISIPSAALAILCLLIAVHAIGSSKGDESGVWVGVVFFLLVAVVYTWVGRQPPLTAAQKAQQAAFNQALAARFAGSKKLSRVGVNTTGGLACPRCGGTSFTARRSTKRRAVIAASVVVPPGPLGFGAFLGKNQVECVTCGHKYKRG